MMKKVTNVFEPSVYDSCLSISCNNETSHKSGYCDECRTKTCVACGNEVTFRNPFNPKKPVCGNCKNRKWIPR
jgi:hypothetical protein